MEEFDKKKYGCPEEVFKMHLGEEENNNKDDNLEEKIYLSE